MESPSLCATAAGSASHKARAGAATTWSGASNARAVRSAIADSSYSAPSNAIVKHAMRVRRAASAAIELESSPPLSAHAVVP